MAAKETRIVTQRLREFTEDSWTMDRYLATGGYEQLRRALTMEPAHIQDEQVKASGLRGRGGAGFGTGQKWSFLPKGIYPRYLAVNGDEGEPSTFKDHMLIERDPHQIVEGVIISAFAIEAHHAFIYVRGEFALGIERLEQAVRDAYAKGFIGNNILGSGFDLEVVVHRGAGAYIAGDETGLLSSLEGERAMPRIKPPFPAVQGLYAKPTVVNNVETMSTVPHILRMGGEEYAKLGVGRSTGTRIFSVSGHVQRPGNYEVELGMTFRELIEELAGGVRGGKQMKFFIPGGASAPWLMPEHLDAPLDMDYVGSELKTMLGSGAIMVFDEDTNPALVAWRLLEVLRPRELRQVHAVPRGLHLVGEGAVPGLARARPAPGPRHDAVVRRDDRSRAQRALRPDDHLRDGPEHHVGRRQPRPLLPRGDPRDVQRRRRPPEHPGGELVSAAVSDRPFGQCGAGPKRPGPQLQEREA